MDQGDHVSVQPVGAHSRVEAFLAVGKPRALSQLDRIVSGHALSLFAIELSKERAVAEAERRLAGGFFEGLVGGTLDAAEANRSLARFGFDRDAPVQVFSLEMVGPSATSDELAWAAESLLSRTGKPFLLSPRTGGIHVLAPAGAHEAEDLRVSIGERISAPMRVGAGSAVPPLDAARSLREARYALQVCKLEGWTSAGFDKLGTYRLLLSMAEPDALRAFADSLLAPIDQYDDGGVGGDLLGSLRAFLEHNARWETAAAELYVHRHTLRYRMRKVEELTGRDLGSSFDRMEFWLAIRARELLAVDAEGE
jgi:purine catabolism regulator